MAGIGIYPNASLMYRINLVGDDDSGPVASKEDLPRDVLVLELMDATSL
jgi:hypothetical protein